MESVSMETILASFPEDKTGCHTYLREVSAEKG
jgi:hypothetical protein